MLFYDLPRMSVDLDFDLLDEEKKDVVFVKMKELLARHGIVREAVEKRWTLFFLLRYSMGDRLVHIDISKRKSLSSFSPQNYLGISMFVMKKEDMVAGKLSALLTRPKFAARDVFDLWFFLKNAWSINDVVLKEKAGVSVQQGVKKAISIVGNLRENALLQGLGELLDEKQKVWVKTKMKAEVMMYLRLQLEL